MESSPVISFDQTVARGCGLDVHLDTIVATIQGEGLPAQTRTFPSFTADLNLLRDWLLGNGITHVAMESTGVYWKPVFNILDPHFELILVNARHIKHVPGHKTDAKDSAWIAKLLLSGLLKGSFIPPQAGRELRELYRYKRKLIGQRVSECNRMQKVLQDANIKLSSVASDIFGKSATAMTDAIINGQDDARILAEMALGPLRKKKDLLLKALDGAVSDHHRFMLATSKQAIKNMDSLVESVDARIDTYLSDYAQQSALLQTIPGVGPQTATAILAEIGTDMDVFPTAHHLASWAGVCPGNNESGGKKRSGHITKGNVHLKTALTEAAWIASRTKGCYLQEKFNSLAHRRGRKRALIAIAHKILIASWHILKSGEKYREPVKAEQWKEQKKQAQIKGYLKRLHELGVEVNQPISV